MKLMLGSTPVKKMMIHNDTQDATMVASDLQAGVTCYAKGQKITGTGKCFSFATYGSFSSNKRIPIPVSEINTIVVSAKDNAVKMTKTALEFQEMDFSTEQEVATITINGSDYSVTLKVVNNMVTIACEQTVTLQIMLGKDEYV